MTVSRAVLLVSFVAASGCYQSHVRDVGDSAIPVDAPAFDSGTDAADALDSAPGFDAEACDVREAPLRFTLTSYGSEPCVPGPFNGLMAGPPIESPGLVEIFFTQCATYDDLAPSTECRRDPSPARLCGIRIEGSDVPLGHLLGEREVIRGWADASFVRIEGATGCACRCADHYTILYARIGNPDEPTPDQSEPAGATFPANELAFQRGDPLCGAGCGDQPFALEATWPEGSSPTWLTDWSTPRPEILRVRPGETALSSVPELLGWHVRLFSSRRDECSDEPGTASWIAWLEPPPDAMYCARL